MSSFYAAAIGILSITVLTLFLIFSYQYGMNICGEKHKNFLWDKWNLRIFLLVSVLGFFFCLYIVLQNQFVYYWDYGGYWTASYNTMNELFQSPMETLKSVYSSILESDYNNILPLVISIPLKCFGYTFSKYVMINYLLFLIPVWGITVSIIWKLVLKYYPDLKKGKKKQGIFIFTVLLVVLFNPFYYAMFYGYIDVACLVPALLAILLFMNYDCLSLDKKQVLRDLLISALLLLTFLFRRYFAFYVVGYGTALLVYSAYKVIQVRESKEWGNKIKNAFLNLFIVGGVATCILLLFFRRLVFRILENNYADQYKAYDAPFITKSRLLIETLGPITLAFVVLAILLSAISRKARKITFFCTTAMIVTIIAFFRVQTMGDQHIYTIAGEVCILMILGIYQILDLIHRDSYKVIVSVFLSIIFGIGFLNCFFPSVRSLVAPIARIYSKNYYPMKRGDMESLHNLADDLNSLTDGTNKYVYICASGSVLNASVMESLDKPYSDSAVHNMYWTADVDLRDGFCSNSLCADYVVVTNPVELHLPKGTQEVVRFLSEEIKKSDSPIGRHFEKLDRSYLLDNNVTAYIYKKISDFETSDYQYLANYYDSYYPGMEEMFSDRIWEAAKQ